MYDPHIQAAYQRLVRSARAVVAIPLAAATIGLMVTLIGGGHTEIADRIASVVIGTSAFAAIVGLALTADALRTLKGSYEMHQFVRDVIGVRAS